MSIAARAAVVFFAVTLAIASNTIVGCKSAGTPTTAESPTSMSKPEVIAQSDRMIADGQAMKDKGMMLKSQGLNDDGDKLMMKGDAMIDQAKAMRGKADAL